MNPISFMVHKRICHLFEKHGEFIRYQQNDRCLLRVPYRAALFVDFGWWSVCQVCPRFLLGCKYMGMSGCLCASWGGVHEVQKLYRDHEEAIKCRAVVDFFSLRSHLICFTWRSNRISCFFLCSLLNRDKLKVRSVWAFEKFVMCATCRSSKIDFERSPLGNELVVNALSEVQGFFVDDLSVVPFFIP